MAMKIVEQCINCVACESECPNQAISPADPIYLIDSSRCTECVGAYDTPRCKDVCPIDDCIIEDAALLEILIDARGHVARARVLQSVPGLDEAALEAVRSWVFVPAFHGGVPVATLAQAPVTFTIY